MSRHSETRATASHEAGPDHEVDWLVVGSGAAGMTRSSPTTWGQPPW